MTCPAITVAAFKETFSFNDCKMQFLIGNDKKIGKYLKGQIVGHLHLAFKSPEQRFNNISQWALDVVNESVYMVLEGYSMGSKGQVFQIAENTGLLKYQLWRFKKSFISIAPTTIKKFATGSGRADKEMMYEAFVKETGCDLKQMFSQKSTASPVSDLADSYFMAKYAHKLITEQKLYHAQPMAGTTGTD